MTEHLYSFRDEVNAEVDGELMQKRLFQRALFDDRAC
jgi:hypothetical protein